MITVPLTKEITVAKPEDLRQASEIITAFAKDLNIWIFEGEMGAGKTTLIKYICKYLDVSDNVSSPTYSLVNEYETRQGKRVCHFDFYRINTEREAMDIDCEEYFYSGCYCFIEWPSKIPNLIPEEHLTISIQIVNNERKIQLTRNEKQGN